MKQDRSGIWNYDLVAEWPSKFIATVWGVDGHGMPDLTRAFGDVDGDNGEYDSVIESLQISNFRQCSIFFLLLLCKTTLSMSPLIRSYHI
jgi:hypothetical protein